MRHGHPWVFSNEIAGAVDALPLGGVVDVKDAGVAFLGRGFANPKSLIAVRILTRRRDEAIDMAFFERRLGDALRLRETVVPGRSAYRWVAGEADGLSGLILDRFGDVVVAQALSAGIDQRLDLIARALQSLLPLRAGVLRNDSHLRTLEGLEEGRGMWWGLLEGQLSFEENGTQLLADPLDGQKTGHFFDQAENRRFANERCRGASVADIYSHTGSWAVQALRHGAAQAVAVDQSARALASAASNAALNGVSDRLSTIEGDAAEVMEAWVAEGRQFDHVFLDPPAFAKTRKTAGVALQAYKRINALAMRLVRPGGLLFTSSCSHHVQEDRFEDILDAAGRRAERGLRVIRRGEQAPDHPVLLGVPETRYLKHRVLAVLEPR